MGFAHARDEVRIIALEFGEHIFGGDVGGVVIENALMAPDFADRMQSDAADFADALGNVVGHFENLAGLLIEQQMIVAEMRPAHVPMKILSLEIQRVKIREQRVLGAGDVARRFGRKSGGSANRSRLP